MYGLTYQEQTVNQDVKEINDSDTLATLKGKQLNFK
jgi:hypothetical protein